MLLSDITQVDVNCLIFDSNISLFGNNISLYGQKSEYMLVWNSDFVKKLQQRWNCLVCQKSMIAVHAGGQLY